MKNRVFNVIVGSTIRRSILTLVAFSGLLTYNSTASIICTSTGGTSGAPLDWTNSGTWSCAGSSGTRVYIIRAGDYVYFSASNSSPYIDTVMVYGHLVMGNNVTMTFTTTGGISLMNTTSTISGGSNNSIFAWSGVSVTIAGPFTAADIISNGPRYANALTAVAAAGAAQPSFISGMLPITLVHFQAQCSENRFQFHWETAMEYNSEKFEIQHSKDMESWLYLSKVDAAGESFKLKKYDLNYEIPIGKKSEYFEKNYFRLKFVDKNGHFEYSEITEAPCAVDAGSGSISVSPNPSTESPVLSFQVPAEGIYEVIIYKECGAILQQFSVATSLNNNEINVRLDELPTGVYRAVVLASQSSRSVTFVKL